MAGQLLLQRQKLEADKHDLEKTVRDKTEDLRLANERLQKTDQHRRQFFADISHELRTPLTLIKGEGQIALRGSEKNTGEYQEALRRISEQADQLTRLVDELLFIARTGDGAVHMKVAPVSLDKLLERVVEDASLVARDENLRIRFESHTTRLWLLGDKDKLKQLFMILVMNAIRYSNPNGRITMSLAEGRDTAIVKVMDEGMGIPEADIHGIFERFYRGSNVKFANIEGSGLGLPFARAIVLAHNGSIDVESELGKGTTLIVSLPATRKLHSVA